MNRYYKEKELSAVKGKIKTAKAHSGIIIRNIWKVIGFGIFVSLWAPTHNSGHYISGRRPVLERSDLSYWQIVALTAIVYSSFCILGHFVWRFQDKRKIRKLEKRRSYLEQELGLLQSEMNP